MIISSAYFSAGFPDAGIEVEFLLILDDPAGLFVWRIDAVAGEVFRGLVGPGRVRGD